jgi:hypothetical protein
MNKSETTGELFTALSKAQGEFPAIKQNKTADIPMKGGGKYSYAYADLGDLIEQLKPVLAKYGLAVMSAPSGCRPVEMEQDTVLFVDVETTLAHCSGEWVESLTTIVCRGMDAQSMGSAITYARRYGYAAILGVAPDTDDDGQAAMPKREGSRPTAVPDNPADYVFPIDKKYKGKKISEVPRHYLESFILGGTFDKQDVIDATRRYLTYLDDQPEYATDEAVEYLMFLAEKAQYAVGRDTVNSAKVYALIKEQQTQHDGKVPARWLEVAKATLSANLDDSQLADINTAWDSRTAGL